MVYFFLLVLDSNHLLFHILHFLFHHISFRSILSHLNILLQIINYHLYQLIFLFRFFSLVKIHLRILSHRLYYTASLFHFFHHLNILLHNIFGHNNILFPYHFFYHLHIHLQILIHQIDNQALLLYQHHPYIHLLYCHFYHILFLSKINHIHIIILLHIVIYHYLIHTLSHSSNDHLYNFLQKLQDNLLHMLGSLLFLSHFFCH